MTNLSHRFGRVPMLAAALLTAGPALAASNVYAGRWTVSDDKPVFSSQGMPYKTLDIVPCGRDHCGVSVGKNGACGPTLFRFRVKPVDSEDGLYGRGRWGKETKNIEIYAERRAEEKGGRFMSLYLGDGHSFGERSGNMPKYSAFYSPVGAAHCAAH
jgi:hypothetical protein